MEKRTLICVASAISLAIGAACSSTRGEEAKNSGRDSGSGDAVTIAGCLTSGADGRFALTAAPDAAVATAARAMDNERDTHCYVLIGGENLQSHLGKRVEVTGTLAVRRRTSSERRHARRQPRPQQPAAIPDGQDDGRHRHDRSSAQCPRRAGAGSDLCRESVRLILAGTALHIGIRTPCRDWHYLP